MKWNQVRLMVSGSQLSDCVFSFAGDALKVDQTQIAPNGNYAFVTITVPADLPPGSYRLDVKNEKHETSVEFPILKRKRDPLTHRGFGPKDVIYLITPDRFANGDQSNDRVDYAATGILDEWQE